MGYKIVSWDGKRAFSIINPSITYNLQVGSECGEAFLGTTRQFVEDYYRNLSDFEDMLLTYSYMPEDVISGTPNGEGEVQVRRAKLEGYQKL